ncbi:type I restriction enzyme endonuclease domain-containing protein [Nocardia puris]|uniref:Uncharacterized protein DUF3387 n=1 Tax=Nocardia puris TaxID=208602 RepID=A0A366DLE3_9NOCA|nr:type I restriction enzyme endonuclease domain-containing protein [Nocardia puris]RBO90900.1 uncharacterized protein DUF3387 [Nocardia puris]
MRREVKTDWTVRDDVRVKLRFSENRLLIKHKYPPDNQPQAIRLVIEQMDALAPHFVASGGDEDALECSSGPSCPIGESGVVG